MPTKFNAQTPMADSGSIRNLLSGPSHRCVAIPGRGDLLKPVDQASEVCRQRLVQHIGPHALKVASPCQLDFLVKLLLGESVHGAVFHDDTTIAL